MDTASVLQFVILILLIMFSAFFSSAETALTTVNKVRVRSGAEEGNKRAITLQKLLVRHSKMLSTVLIGNNVVNITASSIATTLAIKLWGSYAVGIITGLLTILILLFGEIVPKTYATLNSWKLSMAYGPVIFWFMQILTPVIFIVDKLSNGILLLCHIDPKARLNPITESELRTYVGVSHEDGVIESEEKTIIYNVFDFSDALAKDIMIPRIDMITIDVNATYDELFEVFKDSMYTRIPVFEEDEDHITGIVNMKDLLLVTDKDSFHVKDIVRDVYYTYEYKKTADLMLEMRESSSNLAIVLDEYGISVGMVALEDLLEEIVGEIRDEYDDDERESIKDLGHGAYLLDGGMKLDDINNAIGTNFDSEDFDSIGGLIIELLDKLPKQSDQVTTEEGITLKVIKTDQNRIEKVKLVMPSSEALE